MLDSRKMNNRYQDTVLRLIREAGERMKKTIQKQLIRRSIIAVLVIAGIVLVGLEKKPRLQPKQRKQQMTSNQWKRKSYI